MVIPWNALGVVGGAIVFVYDRTKERRAKAKLAADGASMPPAPQFENGPADVALFTRYRGPEVDVRHFDEDVKEGLLPLLDARGLRHVPAASLAAAPEDAPALAALGSFYEVVPLAEGQTSAGETVRTCQDSGGVVLGSLSLVTLPVATPLDGYVMLIAIGGAQLEKTANAGGEFAVLSRNVEPLPKTDPAPAAVEVEGIVEDEPEKSGHANGAAKPAHPPISLANIFDAAKQEGT